MKWRIFLGTSLGLLLITAPFLWLRLHYNYDERTVFTQFSLENGVRFFLGLVPALGIVITLIGLFFLKRNLQYRWSRSHIFLGEIQELIGGYATLKMKYVLAVFSSISLIFTFFIFDTKALTVAIFAGLFMLQAVGLNITVGMTGLLVLGYAGFYGFGGYSYAILQNCLPGLAWWISAPFIMILGGALGFIVGLPCLRLRGDYLAIVTLGFAESFRELVRNLSITGGDKGISLPVAAKIQGLSFFDPTQMAFFYIAVILFITIFFVRRLAHSPLGRAWNAIREDETAAAAMGISVTGMKLWAFTLSAAIAALAGVIYVSFVGFINPASCTFEQSVMVLAMVILGGLGSIIGAIFGAAFLYLIPTLLRDQLPGLSDYRLFFFGLIMVMMMLYRPQGLFGRRRAHHRHGIY